MIVIIDYGMGNLGSIFNMFRKIGAESTISSDPSIIKSAAKLILPGVGSFDNGMKNLKDQNLIEILGRKVFVDKTPILGICLGMQLLTRCSEEGTLPGLGWVDARTVRFDFRENRDNLKVPHMGWNGVHLQKISPLYNEMFAEPRFYFVHSYHVVCNDPADVLSKTRHGFDFTSSLQRGNIFGTQFHPEKSHKFGMKLLKNFAELKSC